MQCHIFNEFNVYLTIYLIVCLFTLLKGACSLWSAHRMRTEYESKFDAIRAAREGDPVLFTGEVSITFDIFF